MPVPVDPTFRATLLAALAAAAACTTRQEVEAPTPAEPPTPDELQQPAPLPEPDGAALPGAHCSPGSPIGPGIVPAQPTQALVMVRRMPQMLGDEPPTRHTVGTPCASASDADACQAALADLPAQPIRQDCGQTGCIDWFMATNQGDEVRWISNEPALLGWLGDIDTASDAQAVVWSRGYDVDCGSIQPVKGGWHVEASRRVSDCPVTHGRYEMLVAADGVTQIVQEELDESGACIGRLPPGLRRASDAAHATSRAGAWLARAAHLEASAVVAFQVLIRELIVHGAPDALIEACRDARDDEIRHAREVGAVAERLGGCVPPVQVDEQPVRSLVELALDNACEGLVRESFGAAVGLWQAQHAQDPHVRRVMARVAQDEIRHAELSRALHTWLWPQLTPAQQDRVHRARQQAVQDLSRSALERTPSATTRALGLPTGEQARALLQVVNLRPRA